MSLQVNMTLLLPCPQVYISPANVNTEVFWKKLLHCGAVPPTP